MYLGSASGQPAPEAPVPWRELVSEFAADP
jgi:hypothetical protein